MTHYARVMTKEPSPAKATQCNRCGSTKVGWVESKKTGRWYLALATPTHSIQIEGRALGTTGVQIHPQTPHQCDSPNRGGYDACPLCGRHHYIGLSRESATPDRCNQYPKAK